MAFFNPLEYPICFSYPLRLASTFWMEHVPFGMFLVDVLRPRVFVELGTFSGVSFCAFCQAVKELGTGTRCYAVDTWQGDPHNGYYGPEVWRELKSHHDPLYGGFSRLIQSTFDEAVSHFEDGSIDLLHIDGFHAYEAVRHDFETWLPKMSERGVILFHDTNVRISDFGVWKLWEEIKLHYPHFEATWGQGLGVLAVGKQQPDLLRSLCNCADGELTDVRHFFCQLGLRLELAREHDELTAKLQEHSKIVQEQSKIVQEQSKIIDGFHDNLRSSLPMHFFYIWSREGFGGVVRRAISKLSRIRHQLAVSRHYRRNEHKIFAAPLKVKDVADCYFYHTTELPGHGVIEGRHFDLRGGVDDYLGKVDFSGQRVLEIGPASGFLTFEMEKRGAEVVSVEVATEPGWDFVPYPGSKLRELFGPRRTVMQQLKNSYWFSHAAHNSRAKVYYGDVYHLPAALGQFDIAVMSLVLLHCRDPLRIIEQCGKMAKALIITDTFYPELEGAPICRLAPTPQNFSWDTWWQFSTQFFSQFLSVMGFTTSEILRHQQPHCGKPVTLFTVVGRK